MSGLNWYGVTSISWLRERVAHFRCGREKARVPGLTYSTVQYSTVQYSTGEGARAHILVRLQREDEVLPRPSPHIHVGARLTRGEIIRY